jgi:hypothetical protein
MSAVVTTVFATNEYSASQVTTHSAFLLSGGDEMTRQFSLPAHGWRALSVFAKVALYSSPLPITDLTASRFSIGVCSVSRSLRNVGNEHIVGVYYGSESFNKMNWVVNGWLTAAGGSSGSATSPQTNPPGAAWLASPAIVRGFNVVTGSVITGSGGSNDSLPFYNTQWNSFFTASNGYPLNNLAGYNWHTIGITLRKENPLLLGGPQVTTVEGIYPFLGSVNTPANLKFTPFVGLNIPRAVYRSSGLTDLTVPQHAANGWNQWWTNTVKTSTSASAYTINQGTSSLVNEPVYGVLNCVSIRWDSLSPVQLLVRDIFVVLHAEAPVTSSAVEPPTFDTTGLVFDSGTQMWIIPGDASFGNTTYQFVGQNGTLPYTFSFVTSGSLPADSTLSSTGFLNVPDVLAPGNYGFTASIADAIGQSSSLGFEVVSLNV